MDQATHGQTAQLRRAATEFGTESLLERAYDGYALEALRRAKKPSGACDDHKGKERKINIQRVNTPSEFASFSGHKALHVAAVTQRETVTGVNNYLVINSNNNNAPPG